MRNVTTTSQTRAMMLSYQPNACSSNSVSMVAVRFDDAWPRAELLTRSPDCDAAQDEAVGPMCSHGAASSVHKASKEDVQLNIIGQANIAGGVP